MDQTQIDLNDAVKLIGNAINELNNILNKNYSYEDGKKYSDIYNVMKTLEDGLDKILHKL
jgi:hypothetical protein